MSPQLPVAGAMLGGSHSMRVDRMAPSCGMSHQKWGAEYELWTDVCCRFFGEGTGVGPDF